MDKGLFVVLSGPSGSGKGTVLKEVFKKVALELSVSATTRAPRVGEVDGVNYHFITDQDFATRVENGEFLETVGKYGNRYGTLKSEVMDRINAGKDVVLEIEMLGAMRVKELYPDSVTIFITPPSVRELHERLIARGTESEDNLKLRMSETLAEMNYIEKYDYIVVNDDINLCSDKIANIIMAEKCHVTRNKNLIEKIRGGNLI